MPFLKLTKIFLAVQIVLLVLAFIWRYFAFFEVNEWAWRPLQRYGTLIWASFLIASLPWMGYIMYYYYREFINIWYKKPLEQTLKKLTGYGYRILAFSLLNIVVFTINFENLNGRIDKDGKWINIYQRLYPNCQTVPPDLKIYYSKDCK